MRRGMLVLLAMCLICVFLLTACSSSPGEVGSPDTVGEPSVTEDTDATEDEKAPDEVIEKRYENRVKLSNNQTDADKKIDNELYDYFSEKFNVDMEFIPMQFGERHEKARMWAASGDLPDILWMDLNENLLPEWKNWVDSGLFRPLPDDLSRWPNLKAQFDSMIGDELLTVDGKVYALPCMRDNVSYDGMVAMGFCYRADWAEKLGMRKENDVYTWDEFIELVEAFIEQDPGGNGPGKTFGMAAPQWYFPDIFGIYQMNKNIWGFEEPCFMVKDGKYVWYPALPEYIEGLKVAKDLYDRGIIWKDNVVDTNSTMYRDLYIAGQMGVIAAHHTAANVYDMRNRMVEAHPDIDRELCYKIVKVSAPDDDNFFWQKQSPCYWSATSISAKVTDEQLERYLDIYDWLLSDEGMNFRRYGIEGKDYTVNSDGSINLLWPKDEKTGRYLDPYPAGARGFYGHVKLNDTELAFTNVAIPEEDRKEGKWSMDWDLQNAHVGKVDYIMYYSPLPNKVKYGFFVQEVKAKAIEMLTTVPADQLEAEWQKWVDSMMPKIQPVLDDLNNLPIIPEDYDEMIEYIKTNGLPE